MKIGIHGINGKMGLAIAHEIMAHPDLELGAASVRNGHEWAGKRLCDVAPDLPDCTVRITSNLDQFCAAVDVVVDFTRPDATLAIRHRLDSPRGAAYSAGAGGQYQPRCEYFV